MAETLEQERARLQAENDAIAALTIKHNEQVKKLKADAQKLEGDIVTLRDEIEMLHQQKADIAASQESGVTAKEDELKDMKATLEHELEKARVASQQLTERRIAFEKSKDAYEASKQDLKAQKEALQKEIDAHEYDVKQFHDQKKALAAQQQVADNREAAQNQRDKSLDDREVDLDQREKDLDEKATLQEATRQQQLDLGQQQAAKHDDLLVREANVIQQEDENRVNQEQIEKDKKWIEGRKTALADEKLELAAEWSKLNIAARRKGLEDIIREDKKQAAENNPS